MRTVREKEKKPQPSIRTLPAFIGLFVVVMVVTAIIRSRGSRGTCVYDHVYRKVTCKIKELRIIPSDIGDGVITLHMGSKLDKQENYFTVLQSENFTTKFRHVHELRLIKCGIEEIRPEAFIKLTSLRRLDLRYNRIHVINEEMFRGVSQLEYLYLSNNPIERLGEFVFRGLFIDNLVLANNPALIEISNKVFAGAVIKSLVMNRCSITTIKVDTFTHIAESLKELYITHNMQPLVLPETIFQGIRLDKLTLSSNGLTDTEFLEGLISKEINLDDNPLIEFDCDDCSSLRETRRLTLTKTKLTHLTKEDFSSLTGLRDLDLDGNDLTVFNASIFTTMTMLKFLDLSNNDIEDFDGNFTDLFPELATLALEFNDIQTLPRELEPIFSRLDNLTLYGNPLHCNCELRWLAKWLEKPRYRQIMQNLDEIMCETPESSNFTHVSDYGFQVSSFTLSLLSSIINLSFYIFFISYPKQIPSPIVTGLIL